MVLQTPIFGACLGRYVYHLTLVRITVPTRVGAGSTSLRETYKPLRPEIRVKIGNFSLMCAQGRNDHQGGVSEV